MKRVGLGERVAPRELARRSAPGSSSSEPRARRRARGRRRGGAARSARSPAAPGRGRAGGSRTATGAACQAGSSRRPSRAIGAARARGAQESARSGLRRRRRGPARERRARASSQHRGRKAGGARLRRRRGVAVTSGRRAGEGAGGGDDAERLARFQPARPRTRPGRASRARSRPGLASSSEKPIIRESAPSGVGRMRLGGVAREERAVAAAHLVAHRHPGHAGRLLLDRPVHVDLAEERARPAGTRAGRGSPRRSPGRAVRRRLAHVAEDRGRDPEGLEVGHLEVVDDRPHAPGRLVAHDDLGPVAPGRQLELADDGQPRARELLARPRAGASAPASGRSGRTGPPSRWHRHHQVLQRALRLPVLLLEAEAADVDLRGEEHARLGRASSRPGRSASCAGGCPRARTGESSAAWKTGSVPGRGAGARAVSEGA